MFGASKDGSEDTRHVEVLGVDGATVRHATVRQINFDEGAETTGIGDDSGQKSHSISGLIRRKTGSIGLICSKGSHSSIRMLPEGDQGLSDQDSDIRKCNSRLLGQSASRVATKVWEIGKSIGVNERGNQEVIIGKLADMETRDREAAGNVQNNDASFGRVLVP